VAVSKGYSDYLAELFSPFGEVSIRRMFGGAGVYLDGSIFAIADDDSLYLKVDDRTRPAFEAAGLAPFRYEKKDGTVGVMSYYAMPDEAHDDPDALAEWTRRALDAARRSQAAKPPRKA